MEITPKIRHAIALAALIYILALVSCPQSANAKREHLERWYQEQTCNGLLEYRLADRKRVDCLTKTHAIEYDFADKWAECTGQALYYASQAGKQPGCVLIVEEMDRDCRHIRALWAINREFKVRISVWTVGKSCRN